MRPIIEFCVNNMHHGTEQVKNELETNPDYDVIEYGCLGNCGECFLFPFAFVNGEIVAAETQGELLRLIREKIAEIEAMDDLFDL
ncbi:MAG: YuzB family protein [Paenibacillaceae bacterium]|nr:YuzB family protein [Paenibacillaceae bacterium]